MRNARGKVATLVTIGVIAGLSGASAARAAPPPAPADRPTSLAAADRLGRAALRALAPHVHGELALSEVVDLGAGDRVVRFRRTHRGLRVLDAGAAVRLDAHGDGVLAAARPPPTLPTSVVPSVSGIAALQVAARHTRFGLSERDAQLVVFPRRGVGRLAWLVEPEVPPGIPSAPRIVVDAQTGAVLEARDRVVFFDQASVFQANPASDPAVVLRPLPIVPYDGGGVRRLGGSAEDPIGAFNCIDRGTTRSLRWGASTVPIHTCALEQRVEPDVNGDWLAQPIADADDPGSRSDGFSELSAYFHASRAYMYFRGLQGDRTARVVRDRTLPVVANLQLAQGLMAGDLRLASDPKLPLEVFQNAFFAPSHEGVGDLVGVSTGGLYFGQGPRRDYAYDPDVIYHEFTHAVVDRTLALGKWRLDEQGATSSPGALNEAIADYFAAAITGDPRIGEYVVADISASLGYLRTVDNDEVCPSGVTGEVHYDSTMISGALWSTRGLIEAPYRGMFDAAVYKAMLTGPAAPDLSLTEFFALVQQALRRDLPSAEKLLESELARRGLSPACPRVLPLDDNRARAPRGHASPGAFSAPGRASVGANPDGSSPPLAPGIVQFKVALPEGGARHLQVTFVKDSRWGAAEGEETPFMPVVLVRFGRPLTWTTSGALTSDADMVVEATKRGPFTYEFVASFDVPRPVEVLYVQIANAGVRDGTYDGVGISAQAPSSGGRPPGAVEEGSPVAGLSAGGGCAAGAVARGGGWGWIGLGLALVAALRGRRRRPARVRG